MGGSGPAKPKRIAPETGLEPHFHIVDGTFEVSSDGTVLFTGYEAIRGELRVTFYVTMTPQVVLALSRSGMQTGADAHNVSVFQQFTEGDGSSESH